LPLLQQAVEKHWSTSVLKKQAFPEQQPPKSPSTQEEEKMSFSWITFAVEEDVLSANAGSKERQRVKAELEQIDFDCITVKDECRFRAACRILWKNQNPGSKSKAEADAEEAKATLPKTAQEKFERTIKLWEAARLVELRVEFAKQLKEAVATERQRLDEEMEKAKDIAEELSKERDTAYQIRLGLDSHMTMEEFQLIRNCLHPDRAPDDKRDRYNKAFDIFNRLEKTVNTRKPISVLRNNGWEKASPFYKSH